MPRFAANLSMMYVEHEFLDRFGAAAKDGFKGVEFLFPYDFAAADIQARLAEHGLTQVLFNCPPGDWSRGERGTASLPGRQDEFKHSFDKAMSYVEVLGNTRLHVMAGLMQPGKTREEHHATYVENLAWAARQVQGRDLVLVIEPINTRDIPGFFLNRQEHAHAICAETGSSQVKVQMDLYHCQIVEGDLAMKMRQYLPTGKVGHMQIAGVPERHEPDIGELNYPYLFELIDQLGYAGWVSGEYRPRGKTSEGLGWLKPYL